MWPIEKRTKLYLFIFGCTESWLLLGVCSSCGEHERPQKSVTLRWGVGACPYSGFSGCGAQAVPPLGSWALEHMLGSCGGSLAAAKHVGSFQIRAQTCFSWIGRWILYHWATMETQKTATFKMCKRYFIYTWAHTHTLDINTHKAFIYV